MSKANKARLKNLQDDSFKRMKLGRKRRGGAVGFEISHKEVNKAIKSFLSRGGKIKICEPLDGPPVQNFAGEVDNFLMRF